MAFLKYFRKLIGWCPMKNSLKKERQEKCFSSFKLENGSQLASSPADLQESKVLKAQVLYRGYGIAKIIFSALIIFIILAICSFAISNLYLPAPGSIFHIFPSLILYLALLALILYNRTTVRSIPDKIIIRRHLFKSLVLRKEDIVQTSVSKNKSHSYRWPLRLLILAALTIQLPQTVENITRDLQMEAAPAFVKLSSVLVDFWIVAYVLVIYYYIFELAAPYQRILKITTRSNLNLEFYTEEPEEIMTIFKNKSE